MGLKERIIKLEIALQQTIQVLDETRNVVNRLAALQGLEWSQDLKDFVAKEKLDEIRKNPR